MHTEFPVDSKGDPVKAFVIFSGMKKEIKKLSE